MYISHKYKFVFLRTPKTASSSLSEFFIKNIPDPDAVYTPVEDTKIPGTVAKGLVTKYRTNFRFYHWTIEDLVRERVLTEEQAKTYDVFSVLREPVDRQKSFLYFYGKWKAKGKPITLEHYKEWAPDGYFKDEPNSAMLQTDFLKLKGKYVGDFWLYEDIFSNLILFLNKRGITPIEPLKQHKSNFRKDRENEIVFDKESLNKMRAHFYNDFEMYNKKRIEYGRSK